MADDLADDLRHCVECGAVCDHRVQVCECDPAVCPLPPVDRPGQGRDRG